MLALGNWKFKEICPIWVPQQQVARLSDLRRAQSEEQEMAETAMMARAPENVDDAREWEEVGSDSGS